MKCVIRDEQTQGGWVYLCTRVLADLLLVFSLKVYSGLDVSSSLLEGLSLRHLSWVMCADANDVGAQENHCIGTYLQRDEEKKGNECNGALMSDLIMALKSAE